MSDSATYEYRFELRVTGSGFFAIGNDGPATPDKVREDLAEFARLVEVALNADEGADQ